MFHASRTSKGTLRFASLLIAVLAAMVGGYAYRGADDPVALRISWFSYLNGDDLRGLCVPGAGDRYRFVYNGINLEQVRTYEVVAGDRTGEPVLKVRVTGPADLSQFTVGRAADLLDPWRGKAETVVLRAVDLERLRHAMGDSGVFDAAPAGLELSSHGFFWIVGACARGRFHFNAYRWPSERFEEAAFAGLLFAWDPTGVAINRPRKTFAYDLDDEDERQSARRFNLRVGRDGLVGVKPLF